MITLSIRDRKTLLVGVTIIGSLILTTRGIPAWAHWQRRIRDEAAVTTAEAVSSQRDVQNMAMTTRRLTQLESQFFAMAPAFIPGDSPVVAGAHLISTINDVAENAGLQIGALQVQLDSSMQGGVTLVRVHGDANGNVRGVSHFFAALEGSTTILSIRELSITTADAHASLTTPENLHIVFMIEGLTLTDDGDQDHARDHKRTE